MYVSARSAAALHFQNRRSVKRFPTSQKAWILRDGQQICFCELVDMSSRGAQLRVSISATVPSNFDILIVADTYMKRVPVSMQWRAGDRVGVMYLSEGVIL